MFKMILLSIFLFSTACLAGAAEFPIAPDFEKDGDGYVAELNWQEAYLLCIKRHGTLLPSVRTLARIGESRGAKGIRETAYPLTKATDKLVEAEMKVMQGHGLYPIFRQDVYSGRVVDFYYSHAGYTLPDDSKWVWKIWAGRSLPSEWPVAYIFNEDDGKISTIMRNHEVAGTKCSLPGSDELSSTHVGELLDRGNPLTPLIDCNLMGKSFCQGFDM